MRILVVLAACLAVSSAASCKPSDTLQVLPQTYQSHEDYVLFGKLSACPRVGEPLSDSLRFHVAPKEGLNVTLLNDQNGDFMYTPAKNFIGTVTFPYYVQDDQGSSDRATVTIVVAEVIDQPSLDVASQVIGLEGDEMELDINVEIEDPRDVPEDISVALCNCAHDVTCNPQNGRCHCHLSLPDGWGIYNGDRLLTLDELNMLPASLTDDLVLRAAPSSDAQHCLDVHVLNPWNENDPSSSKKQIQIHVHPISHAIPNSHLQGTRQPLQVSTTLGHPFIFSDLQVHDVDRRGATYLVRVQVDQGGLLWVRQDQRNDVTYLPPSVELQPEDMSVEKIYQMLDRHSNFNPGNRPFENEELNNGVQTLKFLGSLEGINEVLSTLTFVPWCPQWPSPPSWPLPEKSWMVPPEHADTQQPFIWPQWYPRFWYPFPTNPWTWWPRVMPPWWINTACSDWMTHLTMVVQEIPALTCKQTAETTVSTWEANIDVDSGSYSPKSLVTDNLFSYFPPEARNFGIQTVYLKSLTPDLGMNFRFNLSVIESQLATVTFASSGLNYTDCQTMNECNEKLQEIRVQLKDGVQDVCKVSIQVDLYKGNSQRLGDRLVVWGYKTTRECVDVTVTHPDFELQVRDNTIVASQGEIEYPLNVEPNTDQDITDGILHVKIYAEHGLVTLNADDGLRVYSDHMGQHEGIPTYLCVSGPAHLVLNALRTAKFTPLKTFKGETYVMFDYGLPTTAVRLTFGEDVVKPMRRLAITVRVVNGQQPYQPVVRQPEEICVSESSPIPINMTSIVRRFIDEEIVSFSMSADRGSLELVTTDKGLYECPSVDESMVGTCEEQCTRHDECVEDGQLCCSNGCGHMCAPANLKAQLQVLNTGQIYMHGNTSDINQNIFRNAIRYVPSPCNVDRSGNIIDDMIDSYTDTISIQIIPSRNPEGDSTFASIPVRVTCTVREILDPVSGMVAQTPANCEWSQWSQCNLESSVCGMGSRSRQQICNSEEIVEVRPCLNCTCAPVSSVIAIPSSALQGCSSVDVVPQCPQDCTVDKYHTETVDFECQPPSGDETKVLPRRQMNIQVHDTCLCNACLMY